MARFRYGPLEVEIKESGRPEALQYTTTLRAPSGRYSGKWYSLYSDVSLKDIAENVVEWFFMALVPDDFWVDAVTPDDLRSREAMLEDAAEIGEGVLREAYEAVMAERKREEERARRRGMRRPGTKEWLPDLPEEP